MVLCYVCFILSVFVCFSFVVLDTSSVVSFRKKRVHVMWGIGTDSSAFRTDINEYKLTLNFVLQV